MQKKFFSKICVVLAMTLTWSCFGGCFGMVYGDTSSTPKEYTVQYTDDTGLHTLSVTSGAVYALETVPEKYGYEFLGLFDAKTGGTQYIDETGSSLSAFTDDKNLVLFPQFKAKEYTLILDYQGAPVTGSRSVKVDYDSTIEKLPINLSYAHNEFKGWYTEPNGKGTKIADKYGVLPEKSKVTQEIFDLSETDNNIYLYAAFEAVKYSVKFYIGGSNTPEELQVEHGTDIKNVVPETRVNGNAVLTWSTVKNDTNKEHIFTGKVISDLVLYATEYAPVIDFDENGGEEVVPVVARAESAVSLPTPTRENYKFIEWQDENGNAYTSTTMPAQSVTLKAVWQAKLVFDENGGTEVDDISKATGESIELPMPEKEGFIFAGWYTADKEKYEAKTMPSTGIALKAGWYEEKSEIVTVIGSTAYDLRWGGDGKPVTTALCYTFDFNNFFKDNENVNIMIDFHIKLAVSASSAINVMVDFYSKKEISSSYLIKTITFSNITDAYRVCTFNQSFTVNDDFYMCWYYKTETERKQYYDLYLSDFYYTVHYPDTTKLYL